MRRRTMLAGFGAGAASFGLARAANSTEIIADTSATRIDPFTMLIGGPAGGRIERWGRAAALGLQPGLSAKRPFRIQPVGGQDGVTCANRLQTMVIPNGRTAAMLPGETAIASLTGDSRVHFQTGTWVPVMAGLNAAVLVVRGGLARLGETTPLRLAAASPESRDLAAFLAFQRLGVTIVPVFGLRRVDAVARAFAAGGVDAALLSGEDIEADSASLAATGGVPICTLGIGDGGAATGRDPGALNLPTIEEIARSRRADPLPKPLDAAFRGLASACRIDFMLVLPHLTTSNAIALWRQAALGAVSSPALRSAADASTVRLDADGASSAAITALDVAPDGLLALHRFMVERFGWHRS